MSPRLASSSTGIPSGIAAITRLSAVAPAARELASKMEAVMKAIDRPPSDPLTYLRALHASKRDDAPPASPDGVEATPAGVDAYLRALRFYTTHAGQ